MILSFLKPRNNTGVPVVTGSNLTVIRVCRPPVLYLDRSNWKSTGSNWKYYYQFTPVYIQYSVRLLPLLPVLEMILFFQCDFGKNGKKGAIGL